MNQSKQRCVTVTGHGCVFVCVCEPILLTFASLTQKIKMEQVLQDVWNETKVPLLIYATEAALAVARMPLPLPLQRFVLAENKAFQAELKQESAEEAVGDASGHGDGKKLTASPIDPISPSKRKHRADSMDSMDSNRASLGSDDGQNVFDNPFEDGLASGESATEPSLDVVMETSRDEEVHRGRV